MDKPTDLEDRLVDFAVRIINVVEALPTSKAGIHMASRSSYFTNQRSPIANHQSTERACIFGAKRYSIIDATVERCFPIFCGEPEPTSVAAANPLGKH